MQSDERNDGRKNDIQSNTTGVRGSQAPQCAMTACTEKLAAYLHAVRKGRSTAPWSVTPHEKVRVSWGSGAKPHGKIT